MNFFFIQFFMNKDIICRLRGRVVKGVGHLDHVWSYSVGEVVSSILDQGNIVGWVFHPTRRLARFALIWTSLSFQILNLFRTFSSWGSGNYRPSAPFLYGVAWATLKNCHSGHYFYVSWIRTQLITLMRLMNASPAPLSVIVRPSASSDFSTSTTLGWPLTWAKMKSSRPIWPPSSRVMSTLCVLRVQNRIWNVWREG